MEMQFIVQFYVNQHSRKLVLKRLKHIINIITFFSTKILKKSYNLSEKKILIKENNK